MHLYLHSLESEWLCQISLNNQCKLSWLYFSFLQLRPRRDSQVPKNGSVAVKCHFWDVTLVKMSFHQCRKQAALALVIQRTRTGNEVQTRDANCFHLKLGNYGEAMGFNHSHSFSCYNFTSISKCCACKAKISNTSPWKFLWRSASYGTELLATSFAAPWFKF